MTGFTTSKDYPVSNDAYQKDMYAGNDAFLTVLI